MKQTITIEIMDVMAIRLLHDLASMSLIRFAPDTASEDDLATALLNELYAHENSVLDPCLVVAQAEVIGGGDW